MNRNSVVFGFGLLIVVVSACAGRTMTPSFVNGASGMNSQVGPMGGYGAGSGSMPMVMPSGGRFSPYGGSALAGTGFDPRTAEVIVGMDVMREQERHASTPRMQYTPPASVAPASSQSQTAPATGGPYATRAELGIVVRQVVNLHGQIQTIRHDERR